MNGPFDRTVINALEGALNGDVNVSQAQQDRALRFLAENYFNARVADNDSGSGSPYSGFIGDGFRARPTLVPGNRIRLHAGLGFQGATTLNDLVAQVPGFLAGTSGVADLAPYKPLVLLADQEVVLDQAPIAPADRIDLIEVRYVRTPVDNQQRLILNPNARLRTNQAVNKTLSVMQDGVVTRVVPPNLSTIAGISYRVGVPGNPPTVPAGTPGWLPVALIRVQNAVNNPAGTITDANILDMRSFLFAHGMGRCTIEYTMDTNALSAPAVRYLNTPPGVGVSVVAQSVIGASALVYVVFGESLAARFDISTVPGVGSPPAGFNVTQGLFERININAADQLALVGPLANPPLLVAEGQWALRALVSALNQNGANTSNAPADLGGTVTFSLGVDLLRRI